MTTKIMSIPQAEDYPEKLTEDGHGKLLCVLDEVVVGRVHLPMDRDIWFEGDVEKSVEAFRIALEEMTK